jgi:hypothetical protein
MTGRIATTEVRQEGFYWVVLGRNPPEIAYWERGEWWLAGNAQPWHPDAVTAAVTAWCSSRAWPRWHERARGRCWGYGGPTRRFRRGREYQC